VVLKEKQDEMFLQWLSPSYWQIEAQLLVLRRRYQDSSLKWAHKMDEFQNWSTSDVGADCKERILWIIGAPGVGKSTLAAYLVEFTRCLDRDAILAYFFVRRESNGLTKPSDIVRTLAYQCSSMDPKIRASLETLKANGFQIDESLGLHLLCTKLLLEPLSQSTKPIYIILDGLEEADNTMDLVDLRKPAIEILIEQLCNLPSTRLLFLCRPESVLSNVKDQSIFRSIGFNDNKKDIEAYVRQQLTEHKSLQTRFAKEGIEPVEFFLCNSNGIFLWVVLLMEQLSKAPRTTFQRYVRDVTQAPSDMTQLYMNILHNLNPEQRRWVREILYWMIAPRRLLTTEELQSAVEWCLDDELGDFQEFLERQCGSLFLIAGIGQQGGVVQIVHETLRSFLENTDKCPPDLHVSVDAAHKHITAAGLQLLATDGSESQSIYRYVAENWNYHLINVKRSPRDNDILVNLYRFFHSPNLRRWVYHELVEGWNTEDLLAAETDIEDKVLRDVRDWLLRYQQSGTDQGSHALDDLNRAITWIDYVVGRQSKLGEYVGKASALIWFFEDLKSMKSIIAGFELATRHYWRREERIEFSNRDELEQLINTNFAPMLSWAQASQSKIENTIVERNMEVAHLMLKRWDENLAFKVMITNKSEVELWQEIHALHCFKSLKSAPGPSALVRVNPRRTLSSRLQAAAHESSETLVEAVDTLKRAVASDPSNYTAWVELGDAQRAVNNYGEALTAYQTALNFKPREIGLYENIAEVFRAIGDHQKSIQTFETAVQQIPDAEAWTGLGKAYRAALDEEKAKECFQRSVEMNPAFAPAWKSLVDIYNIKKEFDQTVEAYEKESIADPTCSWVWSGLGDAYRGQNRNKKAISAYRTAVERNPMNPWAWTCLADAYRVDHRYDEAIKAFWVSIEKNPRDSWPWKGLIDSYNANKEIGRAIALCIKAIERLPIDYSLHITLGRLFMDNGHHQMASESFANALEKCPAKEYFLFAYVSLPTSHLFSNYPVISIDENITSFVLWSSVTRTMQETGKTADATGIFDAAISVYKSAIQNSSDNRLLWVYSSFLASRGFDPFENRNNLPVEILWTLLGEVYRAKEDYRGAVEAYESALVTLPKNKWLWRILGDMCKLCDEHQKAAQAHRTSEMVDERYCKTFYCF
jgi:tetratricopeptide (TPR) repeat protein